MASGRWNLQGGATLSRNLAVEAAEQTFGIVFALTLAKVPKLDTTNDHKTSKVLLLRRRARMTNNTSTVMERARPTPQIHLMAFDTLTNDAAKHN